MRMESLKKAGLAALAGVGTLAMTAGGAYAATKDPLNSGDTRSEEHTSELQSPC